MPFLLPIVAGGESSRARGLMVSLSIAALVSFDFGRSTVFGAETQALNAPQLLVKAQPAPASSFDWTGFYVGGHVGYSRGNARVTVVDDDPTNFSKSFGSLTGGLQGGYNYVLPSRLLLGIEADASFLNYLSADDLAWFRTTQDTDIAEKIEFMSTVRGRLGYAFDHWMVYATGGFAWSLGRFLQTPGVIDDPDKTLHLHTGWAAGAGAEFAIAPNCSRAPPSRPRASARSRASACGPQDNQTLASTSMTFHAAADPTPWAMWP
jgi:high affinity Mn2+ porin